MDPTLEEMLRTQEDLRGRIERFVTNTLKLGSGKLTAEMLTQRLKLLDSYWREFASGHRAVVRKDAAGTSSYLKDNVFDTVEAHYTSHTVELTERLERQDPPRRTSLGIPSTSGHQHAVVEPTLPAITLPTFSGDWLQWESFRDQFKLLVHNSSRISKVQKFQYLKSSLSGEAAKMLQRTPVTEANYEGAWASLEKRFGNERILSAAHMRRLVQHPAIAKTNASEIKGLLDEFRQTREAFAALGKPVAAWDEWLTFLVVEKLDAVTRLGWETSLPDPTQIPTFGMLESFLENRVHAINATRGPEVAASTRSKEGSNRVVASPSHQRTTLSVNVTDKAMRAKAPRKCPGCAGNHTLSHCFKFKRLEASERKALVRKVGACWSCLSPGHSVGDCPSTFRCLVCDAKHHTMLHDAARDDGPRIPKTTTQTEAEVPSPSSSAAIHLVGAGRVVLLATARVRLESPEGQAITVRALLDSGSETSFLSEWAAQSLRLKRRPVRVSLTGYQGKELGVARYEVNVRLTSDRTPSFNCDLEALVTKSVTSPTPSALARVEHWPHLEGLSLADPDFQTPNRVDLLLGAEICGLLFQERRLGPRGAPAAVNTPFGWVLLGTARATEPPRSQRRALCVRRHDDLRAELHRFWEIEEVPPTTPLSPPEIDCEHVFQHTHSRDPTGRFIVRLPFSQEPATALGVSRPMALRMLANSERRQERDDELREHYSKFLSEYWRLGHMELVPDDSPDAVASCYLPHHAVWRSSGEEKKIRVVFNASFATSNGTTLNDCLHPGPKLQADLWLVLTRWRFFRYAFSADIVKMFRQILVHPEHRDWQRILWRSDPSERVQDFRLTTVTYGTACAPYLALRALQQLANDEENRFPLGAEVLRRNCYVDDILAGADTEEQVEVLRLQVVGILNSGGFPLDKWASSFHSMPSIPDAGTKQLPKPETSGALGLQWNTATDALTIKRPTPATPTSRSLWTKRAVLSEIARLFDPMGWLAPVLIRAKILLQDLWLAGVDWDDALPSTLSTSWENFRRDLDALDDLTVPRWIGYRESDGNKVELHGFCDASERAYAAAVYVRVPRTQSGATVHLLVVKTKVAPTKLQSIPRLELCGALLLARLLSAVRNGLQPLTTVIHAWSDSTVALTWIQAHASRWKPFVAHRVAEIQNLVPDAAWRYVRTAQNPADLATRGISSQDLLKTECWWRGPLWLQGTPEQWPQRTVYADTEVPEQRGASAVLTVREVPQNEILLRFSSWPRLIRTLAYVLRFVHNSRAPTDHRTGALDTRELSLSRTIVHKISQRDWFDHEFEDLSRGKPLQRSSSLITLRPFLDKQGVIRVGGRLQQSLLGANQRHPIVIDRRSHVAELIIRMAHGRTLHGGFNLTRSYLMQEYWIPRSRTVIKRVLQGCVRCARFKGATCHQQMGSLPAVRLQPAKPFLRSAVDYAGPLLLRCDKGRNRKMTKGYIAVFVCLCTKAVHLEVVSDLTTAAFIAAFRRFVSRRGQCQTMLSDNSTTFRGADARLKEMFNAASRFFSETVELLATDGTEWSFIPPYSPHFGGLWEAAVKSAKTHLRRTIGDQALTYEELTTLLCQIEACLNSRPLCPLSDDPNDLTPLTPNHLLVGEAAAAVPESASPLSYDRGLKRWSLVTTMTHDFWRRWKAEYLNQLQHLPKWHRRRPNLAAGTLVLVKDEALPPTKWSLARVTHTHPGADGLVRVATVKTATRTLTRATTRLVPLPVQSADDSNVEVDVTPDANHSTEETVLSRRAANNN